MSIEIGSKWIKDGEVVEVKQVSEILNDNLYYPVIWFSSLTEKYKKILTERDFLEQYNTFEEPKQTVVIEKWLMQNKHEEYKTHFILEASREEIELHEKGVYEAKPLKLLDTYEVTL